MHQQHTVCEKIVGKGEIAHHEQFLLFPQCFLLNQIIVSPFFHILFKHHIFICEKIVGKGEIAHHEQFLLFPQCFLPNQIIVSPFVYILFNIISLFAVELEEPKNMAPIFEENMVIMHDHSLELSLS